MDFVDHRETAAYKVTLGSTADQVDCETVVWSFEHAECFYKTEVAQNIDGQIVAPIRYILWRRPGRLPGEFGLRSHFSNLLADSLKAWLMTLLLRAWASLFVALWVLKASFCAGKTE